MAARRLSHPRLGIARLARAALVFASLVVVLVTLLAFYKIEAPPTAISGDVGNPVNRALQQLDLICNGRNCTLKDERLLKETESSDATSALKTSVLPEEEDRGKESADLALEEAVPEELVPDQESPALLTQQLSTKAPNTTTAPQLKASDTRQTPVLPGVVGKTSPVKSKAKEPAKIRVKGIASVSAKSLSKVAIPQMPENPPILTKLLYEPGHSIKAADVCPDLGSGMKLIVLVTTAISHVEAREAVRNTWGHVALRKDVGFAFFAGQSENSTHNRLLAAESKIYGDIIQGNFLDSYNNLTLKTISMLEWVKTYCPNAKYFLKTDDDMFINFPKLFSILDSKDRRRTIMGKLARKWKPIRNTTSKYYMPPKLFAEKLYPDFNTGPAYIITSDMIEELYNRSLEARFFKLEDVYVTGMIAGKMPGVTHVNYAEFINRRVKLDTCVVKKAVSIHMVKTFEMYDLWKRVSDGLAKCK